MKRIIAALALALSLAAGAHAAELKIAVIDMQKAFQEYEKTKTIEIKLNQQMEVFKEYSSQLNQQYQNLRKQYEAARDDSQNIAFSGAERENKRQKAQQLYESLKLKEQEMTSYSESRKTQIRDMYTKLRNEVVEEIRKAVHNKAVLEGYTIVLDQSGESLNDVGFVVYIQPGLDITDSIIQDLNRGYRKNAKDPVAGAAAASEK
ncbi:MAG: OmpH family outer membrane protein [Lentisphaeria bacterium]|nr:OmpH family outer membrane protein [Lentisphaeria bacterium]